MHSVDPGKLLWNNIGPEYRDHLGETLPRDFDGAAGLHYTNRTGRNDIVAAKVARDSSAIYFYAGTRAALAPNTDPNWMWLLIDADQNAATGWEGFDFIVGPDIQTGRLTPILSNYRMQELSIYAIYPERKHLSPKVRAFIDFMSKKIGEKPDWEV